MKALLLAFALLVPLSAYAERISLKNMFSEDNADVFQIKHILSYEAPIASRLKKMQWGGYLGNWLIEEPVGDERFNLLGVTGLLEGQKYGELELAVGLIDSNDWSVTPVNLYYRQKNYLPWYYEMSFERNIVDAFLAVENRITVDSYSVSLDIPLTQQVTAVAAALYQSFSDDNNKTGIVLKGIYSSKDITGLSVALVYKQRLSSFSSPFYFSPDKQQQLYLEAVYAKAVLSENFVFRSSVSAGSETINDSFDNDMMAFEFSLRGWLSDQHGIETKIGCSNSGDVFSSQIDRNYRFCYGWLNYTYAY